MPAGERRIALDLPDPDLEKVRVFKALRNWLSDEDGETVVAPSDEAADLERRLDKRHDFSGHQVGIRDRRVQSVIHLKDLSCKGACGITDMPIAAGAMVFLEIRKKRFTAAEVRWVKHSLIGLRFFRPLQPDMVEKAHAAHVLRLAGKGPGKRRK